MCIGTPLRVAGAAGDGRHAWCEADGERELLDMALVGVQPPGTWVLAFQGAARQVMEAAEAEQVRAARRALAAVLAGEADVDACFADLVDRKPELPPHLRPADR